MATDKFIYTAALSPRKIVIISDVVHNTWRIIRGSLKQCACILRILAIKDMLCFSFGISQLSLNAPCNMDPIRQNLIEFSTNGTPCVPCRKYGHKLSAADGRLREHWRLCHNSRWILKFLGGNVTISITFRETCEKIYRADSVNFSFIVSSATDEVVVTHLPLHPLTSLAFFNGGSLFAWRLRQSNQMAGTTTS